MEVDDVVHGDVEDVIPDSEGRKRIVQHVSYERSRNNRAMAIMIHGTRCQACGFGFDEFYGREHAGSYIERSIMSNHSPSMKERWTRQAT